MSPKTNCIRCGKLLDYPEQDCSTCEVLDERARVAALEAENARFRASAEATDEHFAKWDAPMLRTAISFERLSNAELRLALHRMTRERDALQVDAQWAQTVKKSLPKIPDIADVCDRIADDPVPSWVHTTFHAIADAFRDEERSR